MARTFGGVSTDRVVVPNYTGLDSPVVSISWWSYRTGPGGASTGRMLDKASAGGSNVSWIILNNNATSQYQFGAARWAGDGVFRWTWPALNTWAHHLITYSHSSTSEVPVVYLNGTSVSVSVTTTPTGALENDTSDIYIGNVSSVNRVWAGRLCEVAVWDRILSADEALALSKGRPAVEFLRNLVGYWPLEGRFSPETNVVAGNHGTVTGTVYVDHPPTVYKLQTAPVQFKPAPTAISLTADAGAYVYTGTAAFTLYNRLVGADAASYVLTGGVVALTKSIIVTADGGAYTFVGTDAGLRAARVVQANSGLYTVTGTDASLSHITGIILTAEGGVYAVTGAAINFLRNRIFQVSPGVYAVSGKDVNLTAGVPTLIGVVPVRYILTGDTANIVPVETVVTSEPGTVPVREFVGPANVVPVREAAGETPRVKVRKS